MPKFVIHKHNATNLHYDFRLEISKVLKSWVVPKGPSLNPKQKRLAIETEDHELSYASFEGVIPEGQYGAGVVMVWDKGTFVNISEDKLSAKQAYDKGHLSFELKGKKLKGEFSLVRFHPPKQWLLIKKEDRHATKKDILKSSPNSAKSGKRMREIG